MAERMTIHRDREAIYDIVLETSFNRLGEEAAAVMKRGKKACIVTDSNVGPLYGEAVEEQLAPNCSRVDTFTFPAGEEHKNLDTVRDLYEFLIQNRYDRGDMLVALGGGVVGDLCGFAAATYLRGVDFIQIPTTLLSQVDSSIGGKTGVDFDAYKNMVGAFHMPKLVYSNTAALLTLPGNQFASGMGEIIKHGLIRDRDYYGWLSDHADGIARRDLSVCEEMIVKSDQIKREVVEKDPTEQGDRALLNFGHTLGHAIEKLMDFKMLHGECVALGFLGAAYISAKRGMISMEDTDKLRSLVQSFNLPVTVAGLGLDLAKVVETTKSDKKMDSGAIKFILLEAVGKAYVDRTVTTEEMLGALKWLQGGTDER